MILFLTISVCFGGSIFGINGTGLGFGSHLFNSCKWHSVFLGLRASNNLKLMDRSDFIFTHRYLVSERAKFNVQKNASASKLESDKDDI